MEQFTITGQTPAQKNSKQIFVNKRTGKPFITSNDRVKGWQQTAHTELTAYRTAFSGKVRVSYHFYVEDDRGRDLDNMIASVNDALQASGIIKNDKWQTLTIGSATASIDRVNPRAIISVEDLDL
jgi:Holliday junction resolvase RusA-like endonuclease